MKILVVGSGGREHALVWKIAQSPRKPIFLRAGECGHRVLATCVPIKADDLAGLKTSRSKKRSISPWSVPKRRWRLVLRTNSEKLG